MLTDEGIAAAEKLLGVDNLYAPHHMEDLHVVQNALRAHIIYKLDVDYVVKDGQVVIVDEFTGRLMEGRRWSDGLHQAVEAKERVQVQNESQTYATITFQNYFRMYQKLVGHDRHRGHGSPASSPASTSSTSWSCRPTARWCARTTRTWSTAPRTRSGRR